MRVAVVGRMRKMLETVAVAADLGLGNGALLSFFMGGIIVRYCGCCNGLSAIRSLSFFPSLFHIFFPPESTWPGNEIRQIGEVPNVFSELYFRIPSTAVSQFTIHKGGLLPLPIDNIEIPLTSQRGGLCRA